MAQEATNTTDILASLKANNQGWSIGLFQDQHAVQSFVCFQCKCVCCDAVELGCDHDDDDIFLYCHSCLTQLVNQNDNKCPIDQHNDPTIIPNRTLRRQISKSMTYCPHSSAYKSEHAPAHKNDDNNQIMDTLGGDDQKEGNPQVPPHNQSSLHARGCQWQGTLNDLIQKHIVPCMQKNDPSYSLRIKIKDLQQENAQLKQLITTTQSENINDAERYKAQIVALQNQIQQKQTKIDQLKTKIKESQMIIQTVNENVTVMQNEVSFQSFQNNKLKQEISELKKTIAKYQSQLTSRAQLNDANVNGDDDLKEEQILIQKKKRKDKTIVCFDTYLGGLESDKLRITKGGRCINMDYFSYSLYIISSHGFSSGQHKWEIKAIKTGDLADEIGICSSWGDLEVNGNGIADMGSEQLGARAVYTNDPTTGVAFHDAYDENNKLTYNKKFKKKANQRSSEFVWSKGDVIKVALKLSKMSSKCYVNFYLNDKQVGKSIPLAKDLTYYPILCAYGSCQYQLIAS
eukprot:633903_1